VKASPEQSGLSTNAENFFAVQQNDRDVMNVIDVMNVMDVKDVMNVMFVMDVMAWKHSHPIKSSNYLQTLS
jgi:hypothetical protein